MNKNQKECLIVKLNEVTEKINNSNSFLQNASSKNDEKTREWIELELMLFSNQKIMIEQALINNFIKEL